MDIYIGLDVSLASTAVCVLSSHGKVVKEITALSEPDDLERALRSLRGTVVAVGLEAGPLSQWLYRHLTEVGFDTVLMETRQVKGALKAMPIKTDRRDAEGIARLLHMGWFRPVHCKSISAQEMRALLSSRKAILQAVGREATPDAAFVLSQHVYVRTMELPDGVKPDTVSEDFLKQFR